MRRIVIVTISIVWCFLANAEFSLNNQALLQQLDEMLAISDKFYSQREDHIRELRIIAETAPDMEEKFWKMKNVFQEYSIFDSDSAMAYGQKAIGIANRLKREDLANELHIHRSYVLAGVGMLEESAQELALVKQELLTDAAMVDYLEQKLYLLTHQELLYNTAQGSEWVQTQTQEILDSIIYLIDATHPNYYFFLGYQAKANPKFRTRAIAIIEPHLSALPLDNVRDAKLTWVLSQLYEQNGDPENHLHCLVLSAMADLRSGNREIASLEELAAIMERNGDLSRAYNYITHCIVCAEHYKNRARALKIASMQRGISQKYQTKLLDLQNTTHQYLWLMIVLAVFLTLAAAHIYWQRRKMLAQNKELKLANDTAVKNLRELSDAYSHLASKNEELLNVTTDYNEEQKMRAAQDGVYYKLLGEALEAYSGQIDKSDEFRRQISRLLKTNKMDQAQRLAENPDTIQRDVKDFLQVFDKLFLTIFPNFVDDFNALLQPDEAVRPKEPGRLNTELRIYALVILGISDSVSIAEILHCSPQTVYNKRMKMRNKSMDSKDSFVERVKSMKHSKVY